MLSILCVVGQMLAHTIYECAGANSEIFFQKSSVSTTLVISAFASAGGITSVPLWDTSFLAQGDQGVQPFRCTPCCPQRWVECVGTVGAKGGFYLSAASWSRWSVSSAAVFRPLVYAIRKTLDFWTTRTGGVVKFCARNCAFPRVPWL